jgi:hypothetical protein
MSVKLSDFASGVTLTDTDHVVGYSNTNTGGERKWTVANLRNSLITGAATTIDTENLTGSRALISDASGKVAASDISTTKLNYLTDVTANIQGQINTKGPGTVTSVTGSAPISVTNGTTTPAISIAAATQLAAGIMSSADKIKLDGLTDFTGSNQLLNNNGYQKLPGGLIVQWGSTASNVGGINTSHSVTFPIAFPTAAYCVVIGTLTSSTDSNGAQRMAQLVSRTTTGFTWFSDRFEGESNPIGVHYIAIGS